jgi:hypothetical protein
VSLTYMLRFLQQEHIFFFFGEKILCNNNIRVVLAIHELYQFLKEYFTIQIRITLSCYRVLLIQY